MALSANAEVKVTVSHNDNDHASADFKFKEVPSPSKTTRATSAKFAIVDGEKDDNGGELDVMHDGKLPAEQDEPTSNFFFASAPAKVDRSRSIWAARLKLKKSTPTPGTPMFVARRFYSLYGSDGTGDGFNAAAEEGCRSDDCWLEADRQGGYATEDG